MTYELRTGRNVAPEIVSSPQLTGRLVSLLRINGLACTVEHCALSMDEQAVRDRIFLDPKVDVDRVRFVLGRLSA